MIKGIIFDLDGTLIDSMETWADADRIFLSENGISDYSREISEKLKRMSLSDAADYFIGCFRLKCTKEYVFERIEQIVADSYKHTIKLKPGVIELLDRIDEKKVPYGIATATYRDLAEAVLDRHGILGRFDFLLTGQDFTEGKNSPQIFIKAAEMIGGKPEDILVLEDSLHSIKTASDAGFLTVGIYDGFSECDWDDICRVADAVITDISQLEAVTAGFTALSRKGR